eukprot:5226160-Alexandrium_andersonii.AAC.1
MEGPDNNKGPSSHDCVGARCLPLLCTPHQRRCGGACIGLVTHGALGARQDAHSACTCITWQMQRWGLAEALRDEEGGMASLPTSSRA